MAQGSATWANRADAGIVVTMLRRGNEAHGVETKPKAVRVVGKQAASDAFGLSAE